MREPDDETRYIPTVDVITMHLDDLDPAYPTVAGALAVSTPAHPHLLTLRDGDLHGLIIDLTESDQVHPTGGPASITILRHDFAGTPATTWVLRGDGTRTELTFPTPALTAALRNARRSIDTWLAAQHGPTAALARQNRRSR